MAEPKETQTASTDPGPRPVPDSPGQPAPAPKPDLPGTPEPDPAPRPLPDPGPTPAPDPDPIPPAALRALAEAAERRRHAAALDMPRELGGRDGPEPVRYGDWEKKGIAVDF